VLARAWVRVIWRCWADHTPYDPARHLALVRTHQSSTDIGETTDTGERLAS
jgi:hypothetical protein